MIDRVPSASQRAGLQLLDDVRRDVSRARPEHAARAAVRSLASFAAARPADARLLLSDSLAGAGPLRDARDRLLDDLALIVERAHARLPASAAIPDPPPGLILGAASRMLAARVSQGEEPLRDGLRDDLDELAEQLVRWIAAYQRPIARHGWCALAALPAPARSPYIPTHALRAPPALTPGRQRTPTGAVAENHWLRIVFATAEVLQRDGYASATVAQISAVAGVDTRAFYRLFAGKREALAAVNELLFRHAMAVAAGAFVAGATWPERVWEAARALAQFAEQNRTLAYVSLIESHAAGASACVDDFTGAFTIFLQEGSRQPRPRGLARAARPSELALEATAAAVYELCYQRAREGGAPAHSASFAQLAFIALAPFLGAQAATDFLARQARPRRSLASPRSARRPVRYRRTAPGICR
jgi:AcrR family transcriptional regulator